MLADIMRLRFVALCVLLALCATACAPEAGSAEAQADARRPADPPAGTVEPARFGEPFRAGALANLNTGAGGPASVNLDEVLGTRPVVIYYWIAGNPRADEVFRELQLLARELGGDKLALYGVVLRRTERDAAAVAARVRDLGIEVPVLNDEGFVLGQKLRIQSVPNISILDAEGRLRLTNGASLAQDLEYKMNVRTAIERVAASGTLGTYGFLDRYYPVTELVGKKCPDFKAPLLSTSVEQRWSTMIRDDRLNLLIFWSIDCPHCRKSLPEVNAWLKENGADVNVISAASVTNQENKAKTKEFCDLNQFVFPTLVDKDLQIANLYQVTTTPTVLIIRPDGVIDSVLTTINTDFGAKIGEKTKTLL